MFGGGSGNFAGAGGYSGYGGGGGFGGSADNDPGAPAGGGFDAGGGGFNAVPGGGGGFGGGGFGGPPQASQGLGGYVQGGGQGGQSPEKKPAQKDAQSMMPLTVRMLIDAHERSRENGAQAGPDTPLQVSGREISMFSFVGCLETIAMEQIYKVFQVNDGTGKIMVKQYHDAAQADNTQEWQLGEYVRIFGTFRYWGGDFHVSAHHMARVENPNEISFHLIEVAHVHLALTGRLPNKAAPSAGAAQASSAAPGQQMPGGTAAFPPGAFGGAQPSGGALGFGGGGAPQQQFGGGAPQPGGQQARAGDWPCPGCGLMVWASKDSCFKCGGTKNGAAGGAPPQQFGGGQQFGGAPAPGMGQQFGGGQHRAFGGAPGAQQGF